MNAQVTESRRRGGQERVRRLYERRAAEEATRTLWACAPWPDWLRTLPPPGVAIPLQMQPPPEDHSTDRGRA